MNPSKKFISGFSIYFFLLIAFTACKRDRIEVAYEKEIHDYNTLVNIFSNPTPEFRSVPLWVWHEVVTKEKIDLKLAEFKDKGFGGFFVHPRYGLITEYLSDDWYELFGYTLEVAEELGLFVWIYDENSYPSGFAGGLVPYHMPDSYKHGQSLRIHRSDEFQVDPDLRYLHFFEVMPNGGMVEFDNPEERTGDKGEFILFEIVNYPSTKWHAGHSYVDLLYPGVTEKFMEIAIEGYRERFGQHFGNLIPGIFTDEPNIAHPGGHTAVRWTPDLYEEFEKRWGYRLQDNLLSLFEEAGDWKRVRHNYFQLLLQMFIDRFAKPWFEYTEEHRLKWTGHYWEHGWPSPHHGGDNMAMYAWHQVPGIDLLFNTMFTTERPVQFGNTRNVKEVRSVANQTGRTRTLSETYGGAGWELTFGDMKRLGDWMYVLGVNFMNQHMTHTTLLGDRKQDYPQFFSYHSPWWDLYGYQNDYFARLSVAMSAGKQKNNILVIEPTTSTWMYYSSYSPDQYINEIGNNFHDLLDKLEQYKIAYDLGSENIIKDIGAIDNGLFVVGEAQYDLVVLPFGMQNIDRPTFVLLEQYLESGGRVVSLQTIPDRIEGAESDAVVRLMNDYEEQWEHSSCFTDAGVYHLFENKNLKFSESSMSSKWFFHHVRELDDGRLVFLVNSSPDEIFEGNFTAVGKTVIGLDPATGDETSYPFTAEKDEINVEFLIRPAGSLLLFISDDEMAVSDPPEKPGADIILETGISAVKPLTENMMTLDYGELFMDGKSHGRMYYYAAGNIIWQDHGYPDNPWANSIQFKTELIDADTFAIDTGFEFVYDFNIAQGTDMLSMTAVAERPEIFKLSINGVSVEPIPGRWFLDKDFAVYGIGEHLIAGENKIRLTVEPMSMLAELHTVNLNGNFSLRSAERGWDIVPAEPLPVGSWKESGYPFYSGQVMYTKNQSFSEVPKRAVVQLGEWEGTVAEVRVNDQHAGIIQQPPYQANITEWLVAGDNKVEVIVYGSHKNLLGPHHNVDTRGIAGPWNFKAAPDVQPPGKEYDQLDYGLMEDFRIRVANQ